MNNNGKKSPENKSDQQKSRLVPPIVALICSLLIPGLGQVLSRMWKRGLLLFAGFVSVILLLIWRANVASSIGREVTGMVNVFAKAFRLQPLLIFVSVIVVILYFWIAYDAYLVAKKPVGNPIGVLIALIVVFFIFGWQIGEIDIYQMVTQADDAGPALARVLWPWEKAINYPEEYLIGETNFISPCDTTDLVQIVPEDETTPYLLTNPTCGNTTVDENTPGTELTLYGYNFAPDTLTEIWWQDPAGNQFRQRQAGDYVTVVTDENGAFEVVLIMPYRLLPPSAGEGPKEWTIEGRQIASVGAAELSTEFKLAVEKIIETIFIGMMATIFGIILALPVSFLAARNLMSASPVTMGIYYLTRTILNIIRSIEPLIWAIIAVIVVGLGPFAGILALTLHSIAALAKLYSESIESIDPGPIEAIQATGANWLQVVMFAVVPQIIPPFVSFTIYRWDINIRMSTIIGFVGGGGIGFLLSQWIRLLDYSSAGIAVWFIAITVAILDYVSAEIRAKFV